MELLRDAVAIFLISFGVIFLAISAIGVVHLPGFFARAHAVAKSETLGIISVLGGLAVLNGLANGTLQLLVVIVIASIANPTAVHALARAAAFRAQEEALLVGERNERMQRGGPEEPLVGEQSERTLGGGPEGPPVSGRSERRDGGESA